VDPSDLPAVFRILDDLHFDGLLERSGWRIISGCLHDAEGPASISIRENDLYDYSFHKRVWGLAMPHARTIVLDNRLLSEAPAVRVVLLHEMVHARVMTLRTGRQRGNTHGHRFIRELRRLVDRGEECLKPEIAYYAKRLSARKRSFLRP
jgi:hypothetical protein